MTAEEIEKAARQYVKTLPALNYKSAYDFGIQNLTAFKKGAECALKQDPWNYSESPRDRWIERIIYGPGKLIDRILFVKWDSDGDWIDDGGSIWHEHELVTNCWMECPPEPKGGSNG